MNLHLDDIINAYLRALSENRLLFTVCLLAVAGITLFLAATWPKNYTSSASIYADNSNILQPLMEGNAVATGVVDQARMAQDILFARDFQDEVLQAANIDISTLGPARKEDEIRSIQGRTVIENVARSPASLIEIAHTDASPIIAFRVAQKYTSLFIEHSVIAKQEESRNAFEFIENQVFSYQQKLQESENRLSKFRSENNLGTLVNTNNRIANYQDEMERLDLNLVQIDTQIASVEGQLAGETAVAKDLSEINAIRGRINSLQMTLDSLRSRFHDNYPDVLQVRTQIEDLQEMLNSGQISAVIPPEELDDEGVTPLHQELRSQLAALKTGKEANISQRRGISALLAEAQERSRLINETEAELSELTRDYNVTQNFYNEMLRRLENARVSMHLDEEEQGVTFKIQESAVIPTKPDGFAFSELMIASFVIALCVPTGLLIVYMELDTRIRSESKWQDNWPPLLITVPPMKAVAKRRFGNIAFSLAAAFMLFSLYGAVGVLYVSGLI